MNKLEQMIRKIAAEEAQTAINNFLGDMLSEETPKTESKSKPKPKPKNKAKNKKKKPASNGRVAVNLDGWSYVAANVEPGPAGVKCRSLGYGITYTGDDFMVNFFIAIMSLGPWTKQDGFSALAIKTEMQKYIPMEKQNTVWIDGCIRVARQKGYIAATHKGNYRWLRKGKNLIERHGHAVATAFTKAAK